MQDVVNLARGKPGYELRFYGFMWGEFLNMLKWAGWEPLGTFQYTFGHPWMIGHAYPKEWNMVLYTQDLGKHTTPEELARLEVELTGTAYPDQLASYRDQWDKGHVVFYSHLNPNWSGSYIPVDSKEPLYVAEPDAIGISKAASAVASYFETHATLTIPNDDPLRGMRIMRKAIQLVCARDVFPDSEYQGFCKAVKAFDALAKWAARGEFFIY
jgi:hypothetical protein